MHLLDYSVTTETVDPTAASYPQIAAAEAMRPWRHECFTLGLVAAMVLALLGLLLGYAAATFTTRRRTPRPRPDWDSPIQF